jgi:hypothetical protein
VKKSNLYPIGTTLSKVFIDEIDGSHRLFSGEVVGYDVQTKFYSIKYEDSDQEDMTEAELTNFVMLDQLHKKKRKKKKNDTEDEEEDSDGDIMGDSDDREEPPSKKVVKKPRISEKASAKKKEEEAPAAAGQESKKKKNAFEVLTGGKTPRRNAKKKLNYADSDDDDEEVELDDSDREEEEERPKKKRIKSKKANAAPTKGKKAGGGKKKKKANDDDDSDAFQLESESEDDSFVVDVESESEAMANDDDDDSSSDDDYIGKKKKKGGNKKAAAAKKKPTAAAAKKPAAAKKGGGKKSGEPMTFEEMKAEKAKDIDVKKLNNPQSFPDDGPYVEPVGIDATGGIVEGIIGGMVQKVGKLLLASTKRGDKRREMGELEFPIKLNTACSGTDAPSIALGLVKECLDRVSAENVDKKDDDGGGGHGFTYEHNMSCELEPFKQAYISRNFPDVKLFPDITKLTAGETVTDVYGRAQTIPESE